MISRKGGNSLPYTLFSCLLILPRSCVFLVERRLGRPEDELERCGLEFVRIDGDGFLQQRRGSIEKFRTLIVMLLTLGTSSVGLDLTEASYTFI